MNVLISLATRAKDSLTAQRWVIAGGFTALLLETLLRIAEPWPLKYVVDTYLVPMATQQEPAHLPLLTLAVAAGALILIVGLRALSAYLWTIGFAIAGHRVMLSIRAKVFNHLQMLPLEFHDRSRAGDLLTRLIDDIGMVRDVVVTALMPLSGNVLLLGAITGVMFWVNWRLTLVVLTAAPLLYLLSRSKTKKIHSASKEQRRRVSKVATLAAESLGGIKAVQALGMAARNSETFEQVNNADLRSGIKVKRLSASMERSVDVVIGLTTGLVLFVGVFEVADQRLTTGEFLVFLAYLRSIAKPVRNWAKFSARIAKSQAGAERVLEVFDRPVTVTESVDAISLEKTQGKIEFRNVSFGYPGKPNILTHASFVIAPGETVAIVGESGLGKSSVLGLIMRLFDPDQGLVLLDDVDVKHLQLDFLRRQFAVALQDPMLFHGSIRDNIAQGLELEAGDANLIATITEAAALARVVNFSDQLVDGLDTMIGEQGATLSNGQKQRIALARAFARNAPVLLVDEPLTALDGVTATDISVAIAEFARHKTCLMVTHDVSQAQSAHKILTLVDGQLVDVTNQGMFDAV